MTKIEQYVDAKRRHALAKDWARMLGREYHGGGGGTGHMHTVELQATLYFQPSDGANNYHKCPEDLAIALSFTVKKQFTVLMEAALMEMEDELRTFAKAAAEEHRELLKAAGLDVSGEKR